jgi:hypothetical protein
MSSILEVEIDSLLVKTIRPCEISNKQISTISPPQCRMYTSFNFDLKSQPYDDPIASKHVAVQMLSKVVFDGYLFIPSFIAQHNGMHNVKITTFLWLAR